MVIEHHKNYTACSPCASPWTSRYSGGEIEYVQVCFNAEGASADVKVRYRKGEEYFWKCKYLSAYHLSQYGIAVSFDGRFVFAQTWESGLFCLDAKTGKGVWRTKSKRGVTSVFVNDNTVLCHQRERALQLIDINTGEVVKEKRPATAYGFTSLDNRHIICRIAKRKWEIIQAETLEIKEAFTHKEFTDSHTDYVVNHISVVEKGVICVKGFTNVWDESVTPPKRLPNLEFENYIKSDYLANL